MRFTYPLGLAKGSYYMIATVADGAGLSDLDVANNTVASAAAVAIAPAFITLTGSDLTLAGPLAAGTAASASLDVTNSGNVTAHGTTSVVLYLSADGTAADGVAAGTATLPVGLAAGKSHAYRLKFTVAATAPAGTYTLLAVDRPGRQPRRRRPQRHHHLRRRPGDRQLSRPRCATSSRSS